jgi:putative transcriptional regulator
LERLGSAALVKRARLATGLSQRDFAERYRINHNRLRDLERGRTVADSALQAYLTVIHRQRAAVDLALSA